MREMAFAPAFSNSAVVQFPRAAPRHPSFGHSGGARGTEYGESMDFLFIDRSISLLLSCSCLLSSHVSSPPVLLLLSSCPSLLVPPPLFLPPLLFFWWTFRGVELLEIWKWHG